MDNPFDSSHTTSLISEDEEIDVDDHSSALSSASLTCITQNTVPLTLSNNPVSPPPSPIMILDLNKLSERFIE